MACIAEEHLAEQMGLPRARLRELRGEAPAEIEFPKLSNRIHWSEEGCRWLEKILAADGPGAKNGGSDTPEPLNGRNRLVWVRLTSVPTRRRNWMEGVEKKSSARWRVHVRSNALFMPGMEIPCLRVPEWPQVVRYYGPMPRSRGRLHPVLIKRYVHQLEG